MGIIDIFWIFLMISTLQPVMQRRYLNTMRAHKIAQIEKKRGSRVILLVHRQETMSLMGFPLMRYIDVNDSDARAIQAHKGKVTVFVPHYAMSGGTLIALAADEIVMCKHSVLGPIDPQIGQYPAASFIKVIDQKPISEVEDQTLIMADIGRKAIQQLEAAATSLLSRHMKEDAAAALATKLATGMWTHDYPISAEEARSLGLPVTCPTRYCSL